MYFLLLKYGRAEINNFLSWTGSRSLCRRSLFYSLSDIGDAPKIFLWIPRRVAADMEVTCCCSRRVPDTFAFLYGPDALCSSFSLRRAPGRQLKQISSSRVSYWRNLKSSTDAYILMMNISQTKLRGLGPRANYTNRATAACRRS
jgi:hypothetical protein